MIKHSQEHRNSTLQYKIQQSVFRAKNWRVPPYIIKFAQVQLIRSVVCYLRLWSVSVQASAALQVVERLTYYGAKLSVPLVYQLAGKLEEKLQNRQERKVVMALPLPFVKESFMVRIIRTLVNSAYWKTNFLISQPKQDYEASFKYYWWELSYYQDFS